MAVVLVVDDDPLQRNILKVILSDEGYETHVASSAEAALRVVKTLEPHVVLTEKGNKYITGGTYAKAR